MAPVITPILDTQSWHTAEFTPVVSDEREGAGERLTRDQHIVGSDRCTGRSKHRPEFAGAAGIFPVEIENFELQGVHAGDVGLRILAFVGAVEQFMGDDGRDREVPWLVLAQPRQKECLALHQGNDNICIEQEFHLKKSSARRSWSCGCSDAARAKSSSTVPMIASSQPQSCGTGSRMTALP